MAFFSTNIPAPVVASTTTITLAASTNGTATRVQAGGKLYTLTSTLTMNSATTGLGGLDTGALAASTTYYLYFCANSIGSFGLVASTAAPAVGPSGFSGRYNMLGQFTTNVSTQIVASQFFNAINGQPLFFYDIGPAGFVNSSGVTIGSYTDPGAWTLGGSGGTSTHTVNGSISASMSGTATNTFASSSGVSQVFVQSGSISHGAYTTYRRSATSYSEIGTDSTKTGLYFGTYNPSFSYVGDVSLGGAWTLGTSTSTSAPLKIAASTQNNRVTLIGRDGSSTTISLANSSTVTFRIADQSNQNTLLIMFDGNNGASVVAHVGFSNSVAIISNLNGKFVVGAPAASEVGITYANTNSEVTLTAGSSGASSLRILALGVSV